MTLDEDFLFQNRHYMEPELPTDCNWIAEETCFGDFDEDFLFQNRHYMEPELPTDCNCIAEEICFGDFDDGMKICVMFLEKMHDRIKDLEEQVRALKGEM